MGNCLHSRQQESYTFCLSLCFPGLPSLDHLELNYLDKGSTTSLLTFLAQISMRSVPSDEIPILVIGQSCILLLSCGPAPGTLLQHLLICSGASFTQRLHSLRSFPHKLEHVWCLCGHGSPSQYPHPTLFPLLVLRHVLEGSFLIVDQIFTQH